MSATKQLKAATRDRVGKGAARAVRRSGRIPAVVYGGKQEPMPISLDANETRLLIFAGHFLTTIFELDVDGSTTRVIPRDYALDPVKDTPIHVDFLRIAAGQTLTVEVPVHFVNEDKSPGIKNGGVLNVVRHTIELVVPADAIPDAIEVDVAGLEVGDSVHISAIKLPGNVSPAVDRDFTVATVAPPTDLGAEADAAALPGSASAESAADIQEAQGGSDAE